MAAINLGLLVYHLVSLWQVPLCVSACGVLVHYALAGLLYLCDRWGRGD